MSNGLLNFLLKFSNYNAVSIDEAYIFLILLRNIVLPIPV